MKKLLAMSLAMLMALSMVACNEKDNEKDNDEKDSSSVVDSVDKDDDSSKEDESSKADDSSKEDDSSKADDSSESDDSDVVISDDAQGKLVDGVAIAGNLSLPLDDTWTCMEYDGSVVFYADGYEETGNNLNIMITEKDDQIEEYTKEIFEESFAIFFGDDFEISNFVNTKVDGNPAIAIEYDYSGFHFAQIMISAKNEGYTLTFTSVGEPLVDVEEVMNSITIK